MNAIRGGVIGITLLSMLTCWFLYQQLEDATKTNQNLNNSLSQSVNAQHALNSTIITLKEDEKQALIAADNMAKTLSTINRTKERVVVTIRESIKNEDCYAMPILTNDGWLYQQSTLSSH